MVFYYLPMGKLNKKTKVKTSNNLPSNFETDFSKIGLKMFIHHHSVLIFEEKLFQKHPAKMLKIICSLPANTRNKYKKILTFTLLEIG